MNGDDERVEPNQAGPNLQEAMHTMRSRLREMRALIDEQLDQVTRQSRLGPLKQLLEQLQEELQDMDPSDDAWDAKFNQGMAMVEVLKDAEKQACPYECAICLMPIARDCIMLGKNCFHYMCSDCILSTAQHDARPIYRRGQDPIWEDIAPEEPVAEWRVRAGAENTFPEQFWVKCPECRRDYADKAYFDLVLECRRTIDDVANAAPPREDPEAKIADLRRRGLLLLVPVPDDEEYVMMVPAKVPRSAVVPDMPDGLKLSTLLNSVGFKFGKVGEGRANHKRRHDDDEVDELPAGSVIRMTAPRAVETLVETGHHDANGEPYLKKVKRVPEGAVGTFKIDLASSALVAA